MGSEYQTRLLAFVDVLGWSELIRRSQADPGLLALLASLAATLRNPADEQLKFIAGLNETARRIFRLECYPEISQFSDTIVLSCEPDIGAAMILMHHVQRTCRRVLEHGYLTRGAIVLGLLYHSDGVVFGPALIEAYRLEQEVAFYPRILVAESALPFLRVPISVNGVSTFERRVRRDLDDQLYVDILGGQTYENQPRQSFQHEPRLLEEAKQRLAEVRSNPKFAQKHAWMVRYLEQIVAECGNRIA